MSAHTAEISTRRPRALMMLGVLLGYALLAHALTSLPAKWLGLLIGALGALIALLMAGRRHQFLLSAVILCLILPYLDVSLYFDRRLGGDYYLALGLMDVAMAVLWLETVFTMPQSELRMPAASAMKWLIFVFFIAGGLSVFAAANTSIALIELFRLLRMVLLAGVIAISVNSKEALRTVILSLLVVTILQGLVAFVQYVAGGVIGLPILEEKNPSMQQDLGGGLVFSRVGGTMGHPNELARFLGLVLPLAFVVLISEERQRYRVLGFLALLFGGFALFATLSRAAWIGVTLGLTIVFFTALKHPALRPKALRSLRILLLLLVPFVLINLNTLVARFTSDDKGSFASRSHMTRVAVKIIQERPLQGVGIGNYKLWLPRFGDPDHPFTLVQKVHNMYLLIAAEMGPFALIILLGIILFAFRDCFWLVKRAIPDLAIAAAGLAGGLLAFTIHSAMDYVEIGRFAIFWITLGLILAMVKLSRNTESAQSF